MSKFPQLGIPSGDVIKAMNDRANSNVLTSKLMAWMRVSSALTTKLSNGLSIETIPKDATFDTTYGDGISDRSGRIGVAFNGDSVYALNDRTLRPSPTIESLSLTNNARGLSRKASFSITCYTLAQAEALSPYFLEPGYTVLIEYGWNTDEALKHKAVLDSDGGVCAIARYSNWAHILNKRVKSLGAYDGFMGYITGGGMKSGDNETWILDVEVTTLGEIPAYLQQNRTGGANDDDPEVTGKTFDVDKIEDANDDEMIGRKYFMMMYNRLPAGKRTEKLKDLIDEPDGRDLKDDEAPTLWSNPGNFVNMEPELAEQLSNQFGGETAKSDEKLTFKIPSGVSIFTDQSYIRLELAFAIINNYVVELGPAPENKCGISTFSYEIDTNDTVLRAHKYMFSTDPSVLFIPNTNLPDFGLKWALAASTEADTTFVKTKKGPNGKGIVPDSDPINACPFKHKDSGLVDKYAFPSPETLRRPKTDETTAVESKLYEWGYLRNLYINLDFFIGILEKTNYVTKDAYYDILNGISSAVNGYWNFQIHEKTVEQRGKGTKDKGKQVMALGVTDESFTGEVKLDFFKNIPSFQMRGVESPFITAGITIDIPSAMQNHILGKRNATNAESGDASSEDKSGTTTTLKTDGQNPELRGMFTNKPDPVLAILNSLKPPPNSTKTEDGADEPTDSELEDKIRKANFDLFMGNASVIPFTADDSAALKSNTNMFSRAWTWATDPVTDESLSELQEVMLVSSWGDSSLLKKFETGVEQPKSILVNPMLLPITFEFETHGMSGLQLGDVIRISDIPKKYEKTILQIVEINHQLSGMSWITSVKAQMRNTG